MISKEAKQKYDKKRYSNPEIRNSALLRAKSWSKNNPEKRRVIGHKYTLRRFPGVSLEEYNQLLLKQNGVCAACKTKDSARALCLDHDHISGKIRGLLCNNCNLALGLLRDNIDAVNGLLEYLNEYSK